VPAADQSWVEATSNRAPALIAIASTWAGIGPGTASAGTTSATSSSSIRTKHSYANAPFRRVAARRGGKRAQTAVAHCLLVAAWHVLATRTPYQDLGGDYFLNRDNPDHRRRRAIAQLERLGYQVTLEPRAA
jgi:transposase